MWKKSFLTMAVCLAAFVGVTFMPLFSAPGSKSAGGGLAQRLRSDNIAATGKVLRVGPSTVGSGPSVVLYSYDVPGLPRNGNPGSFQREQVMEPSDLARFKTGMTVAVEYSRAIPGMARIEGFGTGSVFINEQVRTLKTMAFIILPIFFIGVLISQFLRVARRA